MSNCAIVGINWGDEGKGRMQPDHYIGRCPEQVAAFTKKCRALTQDAESREEDITL